MGYVLDGVFVSTSPGVDVKALFKSGAGIPWASVNFCVGMTGLDDVCSG